MESTTPPSPTSPPPRRLVRSRSDRVISGVCGGIADYFGIDALYVRIAAVASVFLAGLGGFLYLGALLLVPEEDGGALADTSTRRGRVLAAVGVVALVVAAGIVLSGAVFGALWGLLPLALLALLGLFVWWMSSGEGLSDDWRTLLRFRLTKARLSALRRARTATLEFVATNRDPGGGTPARLAVTVTRP